MFVKVKAGGGKPHAGWEVVGMVLFLEDAPSSPRDVLVKARAALQEGVKMQKKTQFFRGNVMLSDVVVLRHHRFITIHTKLPKPVTPKTSGCPIIALISPFCFGCP